MQAPCCTCTSHTCPRIVPPTLSAQSPSKQSPHRADGNQERMASGTSSNNNRIPSPPHRRGRVPRWRAPHGHRRFRSRDRLLRHGGFCFFGDAHRVWNALDHFHRAPVVPPMSVLSKLNDESEWPLAKATRTRAASAATPVPCPSLTSPPRGNKTHVQ